MNLEELRRTISREFPALSQSAYTLMNDGLDSIAVDVDDAFIFRFPRSPRAAEALAHEAGLLAAIRPHLTMRTPELAIIKGPPLFSRHEKLKGETLVTAGYNLLPNQARDRLAADMALFLAEFHGVPAEVVSQCGAQPIWPWPEPDLILERTLPRLPHEFRAAAERAVAAWQAMPPDPYPSVFGYFDGHGWNMAFDHVNRRLNGMFDFADAGFGPLHQEFVYPNFIARDFTERLVARYEGLTGRTLQRDRIELLTAVYRLIELTWYADEPEMAPQMIEGVVEWFRR